MEEEERTRTDDKEHPSFLGRVIQRLQRTKSLKVDDTWRRVHEAHVYVDADCVEASSLGLLEDVRP